MDCQSCPLSLVKYLFLHHLFPLSWWRRTAHCHNLPQIQLLRLLNVSALLTVPADVSASLTSFTRDPAPLEAHRDKLARAIVMLLKR